MIQKLVWKQAGNIPIYKDLIVAAANSDIDLKQRKRSMDKHNLYLPYLREIGAMAILVMVLYGVWDIIKVEGQSTIKAIDSNTAAINGLVAVQDKLLIYLNRVEVSDAAYHSRTPHINSTDSIGPPTPYRNYTTK